MIRSQVIMHRTNRPPIRNKISRGSYLRSILNLIRKTKSFAKQSHPANGRGDVFIRSVILELRHRLQLVLGCVEDCVIRIPFLIR